MKKHVLDTIGIDEMDNAYEWDFRVWVIQVYRGGAKLYCKPGELEETLSEVFDDLFINADEIILNTKTLTVADFPIKDFEGF